MDEKYKLLRTYYDAIKEVERALVQCKIPIDAWHYLRSRHIEIIFGSMDTLSKIAALRVLKMEIRASAISSVSEAV